MLARPRPPAWGEPRSGLLRGAPRLKERPVNHGRSMMGRSACCGGAGREGVVVPAREWAARKAEGSRGRRRMAINCKWSAIDAGSAGMGRAQGRDAKKMHQRGGEGESGEEVWAGWL